MWLFHLEYQMNISPKMDIKYWYLNNILNTYFMFKTIYIIIYSEMDIKYGQ